MHKKGQAAMEFLMTYGWAILAAIIVIAVLAVYFKPSALQTSNAIVTAPFYANAWNVVSGTGVSIEVRNQAGEEVTVTDVTVSGTGASSGTDCSWDESGGSQIVSAGDLQLFVLDTDIALGSCAFAAGDSYTGDILITYTKGGGTTELSSTGSITSTAT